MDDLNDDNDGNETEQSKIDCMIDNIEKWYSYFKENNNRGRSLKEFLMGVQWDDKAVSYYRTHNKMPMTVNKLYAFVMQLIGEQRESSPNLKITPVNYDVEDPSVTKTIDLMEDIVQSIAYNSRTNIAYQTAYKNQLEFGYGALFLYTDYVSENSFDQEIRMMSIEEPESCYWDISAKEINKQDGEYCGVISHISKDEFKKKYPDVDISDIENMRFYDSQERWFEWIDDDSVTVADHYEKIWNKKIICKLSDGTTVDKSELNEKLREKRKNLKMMQQMEMLAQIEGQPVNLTRGLSKIEVVDERESTYCTIKHYRLVRNHILEENDWASKFLPLVYVDGDSYHIRGKQYTKPFIQFAVDTQKFINYCATETISYIRGGRKERFLATTQNIEKHQKAWRGIDNDNMALTYDPDPRTGAMPTPIQPLEIPQTLLQQYQRAEYDLHTILGRYESAVGAQGKELSGVAVANRVKQGNITAFVYPDNLMSAQNQIGKIMLDLIPTIYDTYRTITVGRSGNDRETIEINKQIRKDEFENKIEKTEYDIEIIAGSSFAMQKAENYAQLMDLISRIPEIGKIAPDLAAENLDLNNTPQLVKRIQQHLVPEIIMQEKGLPPPPPKPDPQEQLMQSMSQSEEKKADASLLSAQSKMLKAQADIKKDFSDNEATKIKAAAEVGKAKLDYEATELKTDAARLERENEALRSVLGVEK